MQENLFAAKTWGLSGELKIQGISDLTWNGRKFSGNAMRRGRSHFLFHGTFLYQFDISAISRYLGKPDREPEYRANRNHEDFLTNVLVSKQRIINSMKEIWEAKLPPDTIPEIESIKEKFYADTAWNFKY